MGKTVGPTIAHSISSFTLEQTRLVTVRVRNIDRVNKVLLRQTLGWRSKVQS